MENFNIKNLYVVRPSIVVYNKNKLVRESLENKLYYQKIKLEQRPENIDIVSINDENIFNITSDIIIENNLESYNFDKRYIGINKKDKILLSKYLHKQKLKKEIKAEYTKEELIDLLEKIKEKNTEDTIKVKKIERNYSKQGSRGFHII